VVVPHLLHTSNGQTTGGVSVQQDKAKVRLSGISQTMLACLWGRAQLSKRYSSLFYDEKAIELVEKIDYDDLSTSDDGPLQGLELSFFRIFSKLDLPEFGLITLRARQFDEKVKAYIKEHPRASVVNIGAGLDTTFYRVDNGLIHWYDLDLPAVIDVRRQLLPEPDRVTYIARSIFDPSWCTDVKHTEDGVFVIAGGVLHFFEESQVKQFFSMLADNFHDGEIVFNVMSRSAEGFGAWRDFLPPEQREVMRKALVEVIKEWWKKAPQDQKEKLNDMIATVELPTKPKGTAWSDLEAWWNQLSDKEMQEVMRGFTTSFRSGVDMWELEDAREITKWDGRITVIDQFPTFKNIPRDSLDADMRRFMDYNDERRVSSIIHLRV
jgi:O-methyltransferase involved in polyketide biosynthesis